MPITAFIAGDLERERNTRCTVCLSSQTRDEPFYYMWMGRKWVLKRCNVCTHQFIHPFMAKKEQDQIYGDQYFSSNGDWSCGVFKGGYLDCEAELRDEAMQVLEMIPIREGSLLEVGCAGGVFLSEARKRGFGVLGIEPNNRMAMHSRNRFGLEIMNARIEDIGKEDLKIKCDVAVLMDVLEHIPWPYDVIDKMRYWMKDNGYLLIRGPLCNDPAAKFKEFLRRMLRIQKRLPGYPLDHNCFNKRSLAHLLQQFDFEVISWIDMDKGFANLLAQKAIKRK